MAGASAPPVATVVAPVAAAPAAAAPAAAPAEPEPTPVVAAPVVAAEPEATPAVAHVKEELQVVYVLGGPACGKGTACARLAAQFDFAHLSIGDLLRQEAASGSAEGDAIQQCMVNGEIVPLVRVILLCIFLCFCLFILYLCLCIYIYIYISLFIVFVLLLSYSFLTSISLFPSLGNDAVGAQAYAWVVDQGGPVA